MTDIVSVLVSLLLVLLNGFFVGAEFALISSRRDRLEALLDDNRVRATIVINAGKDVPRMLAGSQLGVTICSLLLLMVGEPAIADLIHGAAGSVLPTYVVHAIGFAVALVLMTCLHVLFGEMVPKNLAIAEPERLALWLVPVHVFWVKLASPLIVLFNLIATGLLRMARVRPKDELETAYTSRELAELLSESRREGLLEQSEHRRLSNALQSVSKTVADVIVPIDELTTLPLATTVGDVEQAVSATGFSRFPLRADDGRLVGYIHVKDVLDQADDDPATPVPSVKLRKLTTLRADERLDQALSAMRAEGSHLALATGADGAPAGVVALEDVVEQYVGTVRDGTHVTGLPR